VEERCRALRDTRPADAGRFRNLFHHHPTLRVPPLGVKQQQQDNRISLKMVSGVGVLSGGGLGGICGNEYGVRVMAKMKILWSEKVLQIFARPAFCLTAWQSVARSAARRKKGMPIL
jgi:hypothetical protein